MNIPTQLLATDGTSEKGLCSKRLAFSLSVLGMLCLPGHDIKWSISSVRER